MSPVIRALRQADGLGCRVLVTGQHREMLDQTLGILGIEPDIDLALMQRGQSLASLTARLLEALDQMLRAERPRVVLAQGDTTTVMCAALACFYLHIPFGHIEAGLRTFDTANPFPEEANRVIATRLATWHFAPTQAAVNNLLREGVPASAITLTGNTGIDAVLETPAIELPDALSDARGKRIILVTLHRRENLGDVLYQICQALICLAERNPGIQIIFPVHPNPGVRDLVYPLLGRLANVSLCDPLDYRLFVAVMRRAYLVISDSGGIQEEAPACGVPVLVLREKTERPEAIELGVARLTGTAPASIIADTQRLLDDPALHAAMAHAVLPYGDGRSAGRIVDVLARYFETRQRTGEPG